MTQQSLELLCHAIVEQAVVDYNSLKERGKDSMKTVKRGEYSKSEIEEFFRSTYGDLIVRCGLRSELIRCAFNNKIGGKDVIRELRRQ